MSKQQLKFFVSKRFVGNMLIADYRKGYPQYWGMTKAETAKRLDQEEITGPAAELILERTIQDRRMHRRVLFSDVCRMSLNNFLEKGQISIGSSHNREPFYAWAFLLATLDHIGVGGRNDIEGKGTARYPFLRDLGKGRKHASDGGAWTASIKAGREFAAKYLLRLPKDVIDRLQPEPTYEDRVKVGLQLERSRLSVFHTRTDRVFLTIDFSAIHTRWLRAMAAQGFLSEFWEDTWEGSSKVRRHPLLSSQVEEWMCLYNDIERKES